LLVDALEQDVVLVEEPRGDRPWRDIGALRDPLDGRERVPAFDRQLRRRLDDRTVGTGRSDRRDARPSRGTTTRSARTAELAQAATVFGSEAAARSRASGATTDCAVLRVVSLGSARRNTFFHAEATCLGSGPLV
jgi:hypothetical protein